MIRLVPRATIVKLRIKLIHYSLPIRIAAQK